MQKILEDIVFEISRKRRFIGVAAAVMQKGEIQALAVDGLRRKNATDKVTKADHWHIGSVTKSLTASMIGHLVDKNMVSFESSLSELFSSVENMHEEWEDITLYQLLTHTSGAQDNFSDKDLKLSHHWPKDGTIAKRRSEFIIHFLQQKPKYSPNTKFLYSNVGYAIAGEAVAFYLNSSWEQLMNDNLFNPLLLESAGLYAPQGDNPWGHRYTLGYRSPINPAELYSDNAPVMAAAGAVHMSMSDLARFGYEHIKARKGKSKFLSKDTAEFLHTPSELNMKLGMPYGCGWGVERNKTKPENGIEIFHNGSNSLWYAQISLFPDLDTSVVFATNQGSTVKAEHYFTEATRKLLEQSIHRD